MGEGRGVKKSTFRISAYRLEVDQNGNRAHFRTHWLSVKYDAMNDRAVFAKKQICAVVRRPDHHRGDDLVDYSLLASGACRAL